MFIQFDNQKYFLQKIAHSIITVIRIIYISHEDKNCYHFATILHI